MRKNSGFERHRVDCGASIERGRGKPGLWDVTNGGPCEVFQVIFK